MRQIKFRAWHPDKKKMFFPAMLEWRPKKGRSRDVYIWREPIDGIDFVIWSQSCEDTRDCILMQFVGINDKTDTNIFEGDIVEAFKDGDEDQRFVFQVKYNFCFMFGSWTIIEFLNKFRMVKVIGNIYEHPELLK